MSRQKILPALLLLLCLYACATPAADTAEDQPTRMTAPTQVQESNATEILASTPPISSPTATEVDLPTETPDWTPTADIRDDPSQWALWPTVPKVSARAIEIYQQGLALGNDPHAFSIIGDCQSQPAVFMGIYETEDRYYLDEEFKYMEDTIQQFKGSFGRDNVTVEDGLSVASVFSPLWATNEACQGNETPLECEFRIHNPSIVIVSMGTNWQPNSETAYEEHFRELIEFAISRGVLPIIATKADNIEGNNQINRIMVKVAYEYDIPLWNFWLAVRHLPNHGIDPERKGGYIYLSTTAWDIKSFTGLEALDSVWQAVRP